mmetsp:Transcript_6134/g.15234  ORF Transcript_6134/g.15234 Transcript_6134/m.15234 type:complete len:231 (+) Transcript_6134:469-1161(+)
MESRNVHVVVAAEHRRNMSHASSRVHLVHGGHGVVGRMRKSRVLRASFHVRFPHPVPDQTILGAGRELDACDGRRLGAIQRTGRQQLPQAWTPVLRVRICGQVAMFSRNPVELLCYHSGGDASRSGHHRARPGAAVFHVFHLLHTRCRDLLGDGFNIRLGIETDRYYMRNVSSLLEPRTTIARCSHKGIAIRSTRMLGIESMLTVISMIDSRGSRYRNLRVPGTPTHASR